MKSTKRWLSRVRERRDEDEPERMKVVKYGHTIQKVGPATLRAGRHTVSFRGVQSKTLQVFLAAAYDPVHSNPQTSPEDGERDQPMFHAGVLLQAPGQQIKASFVTGAWQYLLVHLAVSRNTVCIRMELSQSLSAVAGDISNVQGLSSQARIEFIACGTVAEDRLKDALQVARSEVAKPVFALSRLEEDTSCLHFAMRLLSALGCMPAWEEVLEHMPDAPLKKRAIAGRFDGYEHECKAKL